jgi:curved DNA-binding protein CbpA
MTQTTSDPYAVLAIPHGAGEQQIRRAYLRLAKRYHPDLHPDARTSEQMRRVNEAWEILSSPGRRAAYDAVSRRPTSPHVGYWSASPRRSEPVTPRSQTWSPPPTYPRAAARPSDDDGPGWRPVAGTIAVGLLVVVALLSGFLPAPLFAIVLPVAARAIVGRFD